jgi:hypothetical protein
MHDRVVRVDLKARNVQALVKAYTFDTVAVGVSASVNCRVARPEQMRVRAPDYLKMVKAAATSELSMRVGKLAFSSLVEQRHSLAQEVKYALKTTFRPLGI